MLIIPVGHDREIHHFPVITVAIMVACAAVQVLGTVSPAQVLAFGHQSGGPAYTLVGGAVSAALLFDALHRGAGQPLVGASGAIAAAMGAFLAVHHAARYYASHRLIVLDDQDGLGPDGGMLLSLARPHGRCLFLHSRQVDLENRALARLGVHPDVAAALLDDPVHRGQAEPSAFALLLGRV
jgi:hypothetical protein